MFCKTIYTLETETACDFDGEPLTSRPLGPRQRGDGNTEGIAVFCIRSIKPWDRTVGAMNSNEPRYNPMEGCYEATDELSVSTKLRKFSSN